jgi:hypothetical protein
VEHKIDPHTFGQAGDPLAVGNRFEDLGA